MSINISRTTALFVFFGSLALAQSVTISSPLDGAVISGTYAFSVAAGGATASVEYRLGSLSLGIAATPPFTLDWNTGYAADGDYSVTAIAYDAMGNVVGTADRQFSISNRGGVLHISSPDLSKPLSKTLTLTGIAGDVLYYPAVWNINIDGSHVVYIYTDNSGQNTITANSPPIDTTRFSNGKHELHIEVTSNLWPPGNQESKTYYSDRAGFSKVITIDNGNAQMGIAANYQHVYLAPGQIVTVSCRSLLADGTTGACTSPSYSSSDATVAAVNQSGVLTAGLTDGFSTVTVSDNGYTAQVYVWVESHPTIPHFSGSGQLLTSYQPSSSIFPVAPFIMEVYEVQAPSMNQEVKRAGINTLYSGFYSNPRNLSTSFESWRADYDRSFGATWSWAAANGYHLYTMGDEIVRTIGNEAWWTLNWPPAQKAVQYAMQSLAGSGVAIGADIIDEGSMFWGATPTPPRKIGEAGVLNSIFTSISCGGARCTVNWPSNPVIPGRFFAGVQFALTESVNASLNTPLGQMFTAQNITDSSFDFVPAGNVTGVFTASSDPNLEFLWWAGAAGGCPSAPCAPPVPNTALSTVAGWLRSAPLHVPISWPALGVHPPIVHDLWAGKDSQVSDYFSHYWDTYQTGRTYTWTSGIAERVFWMRSAFYSRQPYARLDRPQVILACSNSFTYVKNTPGAAFYSPPSDTLQTPSTSGPTVSAEMMTAVALGNASIRLYQFEPPQIEQERANDPVGSVFQTGMSPVAGEKNSQEIWRSVAYVSNLLTKTLQPFILGTPLSSPGLGDNIVTAARRSDSGLLLMVVNGNDWDRTASVDLTPYRTGQSITQYRVRGKGIESAVIPDAALDRATMRAGETVVYLFPKSGAALWSSSIPIAAPALPAGATAAILHHGYIYIQDIDYQTAGIVCTVGCAVDVDTALGDIVYQFVFTDAQGNVSGKSAIETIANPGAGSGGAQRMSVIDATPLSATVDQTFGAALQVVVKDANGNPVSGVTVTFTAPSGTGPGAAFGGSASANLITDSSGLATAPVLTANSQAGAYTVTATTPGAVASATFFLTNTPGPAATITATAGTPQNTTIKRPFAIALQVGVKDADGNPVSGVTVTFTAPSDTGPSAAFRRSVPGAKRGGPAEADMVTDGSGLATAPALTANSQAGAYTVTANIPGVATSATFSLTNTSGMAATGATTAGAEARRVPAL